MRFFDVSWESRSHPYALSNSRPNFTQQLSPKQKSNCTMLLFKPFRGSQELWGQSQSPSFWGQSLAGSPMPEASCSSHALSATPRPTSPPFIPWNPPHFLFALEFSYSLKTQTLYLQTGKGPPASSSPCTPHFRYQGTMHCLCNCPSLLGPQTPGGHGLCLFCSSSFPGHTSCPAHGSWQRLVH